MLCMPHETSRVINQKKQIRPNFSGSHTFPLTVPAGMLFSKRNENRAGSQVACVQTSPISFVARGKGTFSACNKGNRRRLHAGKISG